MSGPQSNSSHASVGLGIHSFQDSSQPQIPPFQRLSTHTVRSQAMRDSSGTYTSIIEILEYLKSSFDDETTLDALPIEASGNPGAWNAWQAHRKYSLNDLQMKIESSNSARSSKQAIDSNVVSNRKQPEEWSWDGVWEERVQKGIDASISDSVLYGNLGGGDDLVRCQPIHCKPLANSGRRFGFSMQMTHYSQLSKTGHWCTVSNRGINCAGYCDFRFS